CSFRWRSADDDASKPVRCGAGGLPGVCCSGFCAATPRRRSGDPVSGGRPARRRPGRPARRDSPGARAARSPGCRQAVRRRPRPRQRLGCHLVERRACARRRGGRSGERDPGGRRFERRHFHDDADHCAAGRDPHRRSGEIAGLR
ncbi:MAG: hypothetical protein DMD46_17015, partial [Gemmatimonadetes bacterium]